jgi:ceramide glucosyltransferase
VTIIRPAKDLDPLLSACLEATFQQDYPKSRLTIFFTIANRSDEALPVIQRLLAAHPDFDAKVLVEDEDPYLQSSTGKTSMGPNPKIRSMSRAYREAKGDIVWIVDCNVWVNRGACGRMVDTLCGYSSEPGREGSTRRKNKFVHQLPLVVDVTRAKSTMPLWKYAGGRFEEAWFSAAHAKFYTAINTVLLAPCIVGKSNMFRRSHLNALTDGKGLDFFSHNICEDHLVGDLLWKCPLPESVRLHCSDEDRLVTKNSLPNNETWGNHALCFGDLAVQPICGMSVGEFISRRVRWLRVRKFTVMLATLVEPGTESMLCSLYGAYAATELECFRDLLGTSKSWTSFWTVWVLSMAVWMTVDRILYVRMQSGRSIEGVSALPDFVRFSKPRPASEWAPAWLGRELLALPIWTWAIYGGVTVNWRGKRFRVGLDMRVKEITGLIPKQEKDRRD